MKISMLDASKFTDYRPLKEVYAYNKRGRLPMIQRLLFYLLAKLNCEFQQEFTSVECTSLDIEDVIQRVAKSQEVLHRIYHEHPKYLIVGRDYYRDLMSHDDFYIYMSVNLPSDYGSKHVHPRQMFAGMTLVLVPWIEGMIILPENLD